MKRFPLILLLAYFLLFAFLAIKPYERAVWWAENLPIMLIFAGLVLPYWAPKATSGIPRRIG